jgi:hypothetical protein
MVDVVLGISNSIPVICKKSMLAVWMFHITIHCLAVN